MKAKRLGQFAEALGLSGETLRRFVVLLLFATWFGGFTFYSGVVLHTAAKVFGTHDPLGFVTQQVTNWLNLISLATLLALVWNGLAEWPEDRPLLRWGLAASWVVLVAVQVALFSMHPALDQMLDAVNHRIVDKKHLHPLHETYVSLSTVQWCALLVHLWCLLAAWRHLDRTGRRTPAA